MSLNHPVKDEDILAGFASLHQAMTEGFDRMQRLIDERFGDVERQILDVRNDTARLEMRMLRRFDEVDERFAAIDKRLDATDERYDAMDVRFDAMDRRFDAMDRRFDAMDVRFDAMDRRFDAIDARFDILEARGSRGRTSG